MLSCTCGLRFGESVYWAASMVDYLIKISFHLSHCWYQQRLKTMSTSLNLSLFPRKSILLWYAILNNGNILCLTSFVVFYPSPWTSYVSEQNSFFPRVMAPQQLFLRKMSVGLETTTRWDLSFLSNRNLYCLRSETEISFSKKKTFWSGINIHLINVHISHEA